MKIKSLFALALAGLAGNTNAATTVVNYTLSSQPSWVRFDLHQPDSGLEVLVSNPYQIAFDDSNTNAPYIFTRGTDFTGLQKDTIGADALTYWASPVDWCNGAQAGDSNYANLNLTGTPGVFESVAQFHFDRNGTSYLMALASSDSGALSISAGKTAIASVSAVPEPGSLCALGALSLAGLMLRRRL